VESNQRLKAAIIQVVDTQIETNDPPQTAQTLVRLTAAGFSEAAAKELIGTVVVAEVFEILNKGEAFDLERYVAALSRLPDTPRG
jgi:hypothetical protein